VVHAWTEYRRGAKDRGFEFNLDRRHFEDLLIDNCFYCGAQPNPVNGIDRVDTHAGYVDDNVVTACAQCNRAKLDHSLESFLSWVQRAAAHQSRMGHAELIEVQAVAA
jgi:5-methylcytosine-specific restriction endonuclease McrA